MPQSFDHPSVRSHTSSSSSTATNTTADGRSFDEIRRDLEQGLKTLGVAVERTKQSGAEEQSQWAVRRVKTALEKLRYAPDPDMVVVNRLVAEVARLENELKSAERSWLLKQQPKTANNQAISEDDDRARLLRANQVLMESDRLIDDIERNVTTSTSIGVATMDTVDRQSNDLYRIREDVSETGSTAKSAGIVLRKMAERAFYNRLFLWFVIACLVLANGLFLWFGFIKK